VAGSPQPRVVCGVHFRVRRPRGDAMEEERWRREASS